MRTLLLLWLLVVPPLMAQYQVFTFGVKGGVPAQTPLTTNDRMPFVLGPTVNVRLLPRVSLETGVLFHRLGEGQLDGALVFPESGATLYFGSQKASAIEVPVLARLELRSARETWRPYVVAGPSLRRTKVDIGTQATILSGTNLANITWQPPVNYRRTSWNVDPTAGVGVDFKAGRLHMEPEVRYSYWGAGKNSPIRKNQTEFMLGFRF